MRQITRNFIGVKVLQGALVLVLLSGFLVGCGAGGGDILVGAFLYNQFLKKGGNNRIWTGKITDTTGKALSGYEVSIIADRVEPDDDVTGRVTTNEEGIYRMAMPWYEDATYTISVSLRGTVLLVRELGKVDNEDQSIDLQIEEGLSEVTISGKVVDTSGLELAQVLVTIAVPDAVGGTPSKIITDEEGNYKFIMTNSSGAFLFERVLGKPVLIIGFSPERGFGYKLIEAPSQVNSGGDLVMPDTERIKVLVKVLDEEGSPIENRLLTESQRFNLVLQPEFNLAGSIGALIESVGLYGGLTSSEVASLHQSQMELEVRSTAESGVSDQWKLVPSGSYYLLLNRPDGGDFEGVVLGDNPKMIAGTNEVVIEVKVPSS